MALASFPGSGTGVVPCGHLAADVSGLYSTLGSGKPQRPNQFLCLGFWAVILNRRHICDTHPCPGVLPPSGIQTGLSEQGRAVPSPETSSVPQEAGSGLYSMLVVSSSQHGTGSPALAAEGPPLLRAC